MIAEKEMTALESSVAAEAGQSSAMNAENSIAQPHPDGKKNLQALTKELRAIQRKNDPNRLKTFTMQDLYETVHPGRPPIVDGLLYPGTYIFAGAPKVGKSFLMEQLSYHVSTGLPLWEFPVRQSTVLYLALEDTADRLAARMYRMFGVETTPNLYYAIEAGTISSNLETQLRTFLREHPDTRLVIVDTLQLVRDDDNIPCSYANDYAVMAKLMQMLPNPNTVCLLLVHHTRKQEAGDRFDMIGGTHGLTGAVDGSFVLYKEKRTSNLAILEVSGRDQQDQKLYLVRNPERLSWELDHTETELWKEPPDPVLDAVAAVVSPDHPMWTGTPTELTQAIQTDLKPNALSTKLNINVARLLREHGVRYWTKRTHDGRQITLMIETQRDDV